MPLAFMIAMATIAKAQPDTSADHGRKGDLPIGIRRQSASLTVFAGFQRGLKTEQEQALQDIRPLVGVAPNIPLGDVWELSPEVSLWQLKLNSKEQWNVKVALPVHLFAPTPGPISVYALGGPAMLFGGWFFLMLDAGAGISWTATPVFAFSGEVRTYLYYHTREVRSPMILASPISIQVGVRWTLSK